MEQEPITIESCKWANDDSKDLLVTMSDGSIWRYTNCYLVAVKYHKFECDFFAYDSNTNSTKDTEGIGKAQ